MKTTLVAIIITGLAAGLVDATPASSLNKRRVEKKRDAQKALQATQSPAPAAQNDAQSKISAAAPQKPSAPAAKRSPGASPPAAKIPAAAVAPARPAEASKLSRHGKPPSRRFFSRLRSDASRNQTKAMRQAKKLAQPSAQNTGQAKELIYRRSWGPRAHRRPR